MTSYSPPSVFRFLPFAVQVFLDGSNHRRLVTSTQCLTMDDNPLPPRHQKSLLLQNRSGDCRFRYLFFPRPSSCSYSLQVLTTPLGKHLVTSNSGECPQRFRTKSSYLSLLINDDDDIRLLLCIPILRGDSRGWGGGWGVLTSSMDILLLIVGGVDGCLANTTLGRGICK